MDPNDADANEAAARRLQEQIWMAEAEEAAAAADDDDDNDDNNNNGAVQDFVRQLLDRNGGGAGGGDDDNEDDVDDDANDNNAPEEDEEDAGDEEADDVMNLRGAIDAGIAGEVRDENSIKITRSLKCPLVLYFECADDMDEILCPGNPILKKGTLVYMGLDKNTKLSLVFNRYCTFVNSKIPKNAGKGSANVNAVKLSDFEFLHCTLLDANHTVEASAMMKNDRVKVYRERSKERDSKTEVLKQQRDSDRKYFKDLRQLLPNPSPEGMGCDVVLDCRGKVVDERGFSQNVLATTVRANSVLISKRCKWLGQKIKSAREEGRRRAEMTVPSDEVKSDDVMNGGKVEDEDTAEDVKSGQSDYEDDIIMAEQVARAGNENNNNIAAGGEGSAAKVEDDDEDDDIPVLKVKAAKASGRGHKKSDNPFPNSTWVTLDHSPQAAKLLLEYCYTNRVQSLGQDAFVKSSKYPNAKDVGAQAAKQGGPVPPFRKHEWPEGGMPTVSLYLALAGIALAEEAHLPRLSLMCEIAASQLVDSKNVIDVLSACQVQQQKTGNRLPILRKAAMLDCIMAGGSGGIDMLYSNETFKNHLDERKGLVIPSLLDGTVEVMPTNMNTKEIRKKKDKMTVEKKKMFELNDSSDTNRRIMERMKWRKDDVVKRRMEVAFGPTNSSLKMPSKSNIWRDSYQRDPPPALGGGSSRGTKRKAGGASASAATERTRNTRRRQTRRNNNLS